MGVLAGVGCAHSCSESKYEVALLETCMVARGCTASQGHVPALRPEAAPYLFGTNLAPRNAVLQFVTGRLGDLPSS